MRRPGRRGEAGVKLLMSSRPQTRRIGSRYRLRDAAISLSLANLLLARVWADVLTNAGNADLLSIADYSAAILITLCLAAALFAGARAARKLPGRWPSLALNTAFASVLAVIAYTTSHVVWPRAAWLGGAGTYKVSLAGAGYLAGVAILSFRWPRHTARALSRVALLLFPFVPMTFGQALWRVVSHVPRPVFTPTVDAAAGPAHGGRLRVTVLLYDEMDQRLAFTERPATLKLPELDRLRSQAVTCDSVFPPAPETYRSVPAMLTGRLVEYGELLPSGGLRISFSGDRTRSSLDQHRTLLHDARDGGHRTAVSSGVLDYGRLAPGQADYFSPLLPQRHSSDHAPALWRQGRRVLCALPLAHRLRLDETLPSGIDRNAYVRGFGVFMEDTLNVLTADQLDFIWVHLNTPHDPPIYDRFRGDYATRRNPPLDYYDSLALVDRTLGELRAALEAAGLWESGTLLILSDHWYRVSPTGPGGKRDHRVPFILKLPGQQQGIRYDRPFNTLVTRGLILALLRGEVKRPEDAVAWLDRHRTFSESPLTIHEP